MILSPSSTYPAGKAIPIVNLVKILGGTVKITLSFVVTGRTIAALPELFPLINLSLTTVLPSSK